MVTGIPIDINKKYENYSSYNLKQGGVEEFYQIEGFKFAPSEPTNNMNSIDYFRALYSNHLISASNKLFLIDKNGFYSVKMNKSESNQDKNTVEISKIVNNENSTDERENCLISSVVFSEYVALSFGNGIIYILNALTNKMLCSFSINKSNKNSNNAIKKSDFKDSYKINNYCLLSGCIDLEKTFRLTIHSYSKQQNLSEKNYSKALYSNYLFEIKIPFTDILKNGENPNTSSNSNLANNLIQISTSFNLPQIPDFAEYIPNTKILAVFVKTENIDFFKLNENIEENEKIEIFCQNQNQFNKKKKAKNFENSDFWPFLDEVDFSEKNEMTEMLLLKEIKGEFVLVQKILLDQNHFLCSNFNQNFSSLFLGFSNNNDLIITKLKPEKLNPPKKLKWRHLETFPGLAFVTGIKKEKLFFKFIVEKNVNQISVKNSQIEPNKSKNDQIGTKNNENCAKIDPKNELKIDTKKHQNESKNDQNESKNDKNELKKSKKAKKSLKEDKYKIPKAVLVEQSKFCFLYDNPFGNSKSYQKIVQFSGRVFGICSVQNRLILLTSNGFIAADFC